MFQMWTRWLENMFSNSIQKLKPSVIFYCNFLFHKIFSDNTIFSSTKMYTNFATCNAENRKWIDISLEILFCSNLHVERKSNFKKWFACFQFKNRIIKIIHTFWCNICFNRLYFVRKNVLIFDSSLLLRQKMMNRTRLRY